MPSTEPRLEQRPERAYLAIANRIAMPDLPTVLPQMFNEMQAWFGQHGLTGAGAPFIRYNVIDMATALDLEVGIPVATAQAGDERVKPGTIPAGTYAVTVHTGPYDQLMPATAELLAWADNNNVRWSTQQRGNDEVWNGRFEFYETNPEAEPDPHKWEVEIAFLTA